MLGRRGASYNQTLLFTPDLGVFLPEHPKMLATSWSSCESGISPHEEMCSINIFHFRIFLIRAREYRHKTGCVPEDQRRGFCSQNLSLALDEISVRPHEAVDIGKNLFCSLCGKQFVDLIAFWIASLIANNSWVSLLSSLSE